MEKEEEEGASRERPNVTGAEMKVRLLLDDSKANSA